LVAAQLRCGTARLRRKLSAISGQLLDECRKHAFHVDGFRGKTIVIRGLADPRAMEQNRANSPSPSLPQPSARLAQMDELARRI